MKKLTLAVGAPITMRVQDVKDVEGQFGPQTLFEGTDGTGLYLSRDTAQRQLDRLGITEAAGLTLCFEKVQKGTKTYVNIEQVNGNGAGGPANAGTVGGASRPSTAVTQPTPTTTPAPAPQNGEKITGKYEQAVDFVLSRLVPKLKAAGVTVTHEGVSAMAATVFLNAQGK